MFEQHFALRENPFVAGHQSKYVYPSPEHQEALAHLRYGIENREPFVLITGEVGTGKTTALFEVLNDWKARAAVAVITNSALTRTELLEEIGLRLGFAAPASLSKPQLLSHLERHLLALKARGDRAILLLDEAQNLDRELLEEIRLLSNLETDGDKLLQVFLLGQPELDAKLARTELRQLRQRIAVHYRLNPLSADDTERYIHHRIAVAGGYGPRIFPRDACVEVYGLSHGIPREINQLCSQALLNAFVEDAPAVRPDHVRAAAREIEFESVLPGTPQTGTAPRAADGRDATRPGESSADPTDPPTAPPRSEAPVSPPRAEPAPRTDLPPPTPPDITHEPESSGPVVPATDEASWEAWVRSLMIARPAEAEASGAAATAAAVPAEIVASHEPAAAAAPSAPTAHEVPPPPATVPGPVYVPEPTPQPTRVPEPVIVPEPAPEPAPVPEPTHEPEPIPQPTRARTPEQHVEPAGSMPARAARDDSWRPPKWTPDREDVRPGRSRARRIDATVEEEAEARSVGWMATVAVLVALAMSVVLLFKFGPLGRWLGTSKPGTASTHTTAPAAPAPSPPAQDPATSAPTTTPSGTTTPPPASSGASVPTTTTPSPAQAGSPPPTENAPPPRPAARASTWSLVVGTYLDEARARDESQRLGDRTGLPARVRVIPESSGVMYQVALGTFGDRATAERTAGNLVGKGVVTEARVVARRRPAAQASPPTP